MKVLLVYDTVSAMKLTLKVSEIIRDVFKQSGLAVDSLFVADVTQSAVQNYDCLIVGAPTMYFKATSGIMQFLKGFPEKGLSGKLAAAFDTQLQSRIFGNATKGIEKELKRLDCQIISEPLVTYVEGKTEAMKFKDGELEKAKGWAQEVAKTLLNR